MHQIYILRLFDIQLFVYAKCMKNLRWKIDFGEYSIWFNLWVISKLLGSALFALLSLEINWQECKAFWRICTRDIPLQYRNRRNLQLRHQENPENLFLEMLSRNTELMESMDMMPPGMLIFQYLVLIALKSDIIWAFLSILRWRKSMLALESN